MATPSTPLNLLEILHYPEVSYFPSDYLIADLSAEHPIWSVDFPDGPYPVYCHQIGERVRCPKHPTENHSARTIGMYGEACGVVCDSCKAVYTARELPPNKPADGYPNRPTQSICPDHRKSVSNADAERVDEARPRKRGKRQLPIPVTEYSVSYSLDPEHPVWPLEDEGIAQGAPYPLSMVAAGALVLCPKHRKRHGVGTAVGYAGGAAEGILCPSCKHIYYIASEDHADANAPCDPGSADHAHH